MLQHRRSGGIVGLCMLGTLFGARANADVYVYDKGDTKAFLGGFAEFDAISDTTRGLGEVLGSGPVTRKGVSDLGDQGQMQFSDRNSRFDFGVLSTKNGIKGKGYIEFDLLGYEPPPKANDPNVPESEGSYYQNPTVRLRHAYMQAEGDGWSVLAGQYWSLFGWQSDYSPGTVSVAPVTGVLYERTPQLTVMKNVGSAEATLFQAALSLSRPVQKESATPNVDAGLRVKFGGRLAPYTSSNGAVKPDGASFGVSGTARELTRPQASAFDAESHKQVSAVAVDLMIPILAISKGEGVGNTLALAAEATKGSGYGDQFPGWTGNVNGTTGAAGTPGVTATQPVMDNGLAGLTKTGTFTPIHLQTWNSALQYHFPHGWDTWATSGFGELWSDNTADLVAMTGKTAYDRTQVAFYNMVHNFTDEIRAGLEYDWYHVRYVDGNHAQDVRVQLSTWYRF